MKTILINATTRFAKTGSIICCMLGFTVRSPAPVFCDGPPVPATLTATNSTLSVLSTNNAGLLFKLDSSVGNDTRLGLAYTGTAQNGLDVEALPASVLIASFQTSATLTVRPKANYPFAAKTLTVTITNSDNVCVTLGSPKSATITLTGFDAPRLEATLVTSTNIVLSWWAPVAGYVLQSSDNLAPASWLTVTNAPVATQGTNLLTLDRTGSVIFYRLMKP